MSASGAMSGHERLARLRPIHLTQRCIHRQCDVTEPSIRAAARCDALASLAMAAVCCHIMRRVSYVVVVDISSGAPAGAPTPKVARNVSTDVRRLDLDFLRHRRLPDNLVTHACRPHIALNDAFLRRWHEHRELGTITRHSGCAGGLVPERSGANAAIMQRSMNRPSAAAPDSETQRRPAKTRQ